MKILKLSLISVISVVLGLLSMACNQQQQPQQVATTDPYTSNANVLTDEAFTDDYDYWAKDNLDLQRVGNVLERSKSPEEFERYLNEPGGINNLDLNGDGYVDYISVDEYPYYDDYGRGMSFYTRYGPDQVQELGTVVFYRDDFNAPGARILITGNEQIYGDNYYYETNWLDRGLAIASLLFGPREVVYRSPYYYDYYPPGYVAYEVVDPPIYRTRIEQLWPAPVVVYTTAPTFIDKVAKYKSPNNGLHLGQIKARLVKPTKEQAEFIKAHPVKVERAKVEKRNDQGVPPGQAKQPKEDRKAEVEKANPANPGKPEKAEKPNMKQQRSDQGNPGGNPQKPEQKKGQEGKGKGKP
jgi:hypothetical protein